MPLLYKFLPAETALKVIESKLIKVSMLKELNDIYDCSPRVSPPPDEPTHTDKSRTDHVIRVPNYILSDMKSWSKT